MKQGLATKIMEEIIAAIKLTFREARFKRVHGQGSKARCMVTWMLHNTQDLPRALDDRRIVTSRDFINNEDPLELV